jgi:hypothetical protein
MYIQRSITEPLRLNLTWEERWGSDALAIISCWERGREKSLEDLGLASKTLKNELPVLPWKGGFPPPKTVSSENGDVKKSKPAIKYGSFYYLAMWQGLRGDDLNVDLHSEVEMTCALTGKAVTFTSALSKYVNSDASLDLVA